MRIRFRPQTITPGRWTGFAIGACAAGLWLAGAAWSFEDPDVRKPAISEAKHLVSPAEARLREDVTYLAADEREGAGRAPAGSRRPPITSRSSSSRPASSPRRGPRGISSRSRSAARPAWASKQELAFDGPAGKKLDGQFKTDFTPLAIGIGGTLKQVPIVFAGYGITADDESLKLHYDDYAGVDVKSKAVLIIRREPQDHDEKSPFDGRRTTRFATFQHKATNAFQHGAVAVLLVNDAASGKGEKDALLAVHGRRFRAHVAHPVRDAHPRVRRQAPGRRRTSRRSRRWKNRSTPTSSRARATSRAGRSEGRSRSIARSSRPRTSSASSRAPARTPTRRSSSAATTTTWAAAA